MGGRAVKVGRDRRNLLVARTGVSRAACLPRPKSDTDCAGRWRRLPVGGAGPDRVDRPRPGSRVEFTISTRVSSGSVWCPRPVVLRHTIVPGGPLRAGGALWTLRAGGALCPRAPVVPCGLTGACGLAGASGPAGPAGPWRPGSGRALSGRSAGAARDTLAGELGSLLAMRSVAVREPCSWGVKSTVS